MQTKKAIYIILALVMLASCQEDEENFPSIEGKWKGTLAEFQIKPFGLPTPFSRQEDDFSAEIEFKSDGTVILFQNGQPIEGSYEVVGDQLITDIEFSTGFLKISGTYVIEELTQTNLVIYLERDNVSVTDPDSGLSVKGDLKATLHFDRL